MPKPKISDAEGWIRICEDNFEIVEIYVPSGLTISAPQSEKRFSYVSAEVALRNWYKLSAEGRRDQYFYGETAYQETMNAARDLDWEIEKERYGW